MNAFSQAGWDEYNEADPVEQVNFRGEHIWIDGVHITSWDCPECLKRDTGRCVRCSFFDPASCRLRHDLELKSDLKSILDDYRERLAAKKARKQKLVSALRTELRAHGRPLHYTILAQIMTDRHPVLRATESKVLMALADYPDVFEKTDEGVYQVKPE